jgi:hypothetical protein
MTILLRQISREGFLGLLLLVSAGPACFGQTGKRPDKTVSDETCKGINVEQGGNVVKSSRIEDPFDFLPWVKDRERRAQSQIATLVNGKPFLYATARDAALKIIEDENFLPDTSEARIKIRVEFVNIKNCMNGGVDLIYRVYSTQVMPVLSAAPETRVIERETPQQAAGLTNVQVPEFHLIHVTPVAGFDSTDKLSVGARLEIAGKGTGGFDSAAIDGQASSEMRTVSATLSGARDSEGWLAHSDWSIYFQSYSLPTGSGKLKGGSLSVQFAGTTKQFGNGNLTARFGGLLDGGNRQSNLSNLRLAPNTVANSPFGSLKLYVGIASRFRHNTISASYGLELGAAGRAVRLDWAKQIADVRHEFWYPAGDHHFLDLESRFTIGQIEVPGKIPLANRFFGGNNEEVFMSGDSWQIRANPVIRAIPGRRFYRIASGDGGDRFFSYNLTAAYALWRRPLVPSELSKDDEFNSIVEAQLVNAESFEQLHFLTKDKHYLNLIGFVQSSSGQPSVQAALADLNGAVSTAQVTHGTQFPHEFQACRDSISDADSRAKSAAQTKGEEQYGFVMALLSSDEDQLGTVISSCIDQLNGGAVLAGDPGITTAGKQLDGIRKTMEGELSQIDQAAADKNAKDDMLFVRRTLGTVLHDTNIYSISPVFVFDVARLGAKSAGLGGVRYGPGMGLRMELASTIHFTAGYAWNTRPGPGEGKGTMFFSIGLRDLFQ